MASTAHALPFVPIMNVVALIVNLPGNAESQRCRSVDTLQEMNQMYL